MRENFIFAMLLNKNETHRPAPACWRFVTGKFVFCIPLLSRCVLMKAYFGHNLFFRTILLLNSPISYEYIFILIFFLSISISFGCYYWLQCWYVFSQDHRFHIIIALISQVYCLHHWFSIKLSSKQTIFSTNTVLWKTNQLGFNYK